MMITLKKMENDWRELKTVQKLVPPWHCHEIDSFLGHT